jgi:CheY-like chemotaxis protein
MDARELYAEFLEYSGFRVAQAQDGAEAVAKVHLLLPDVVLMDLSLPVLDGLEATRHLKMDPRTASIPIIVLTGDTDAGQHARRRAPYDMVLIKPCMPDDVVMAIRKLLKTAPPRHDHAAQSDESHVRG